MKRVFPHALQHDVLLRRCGIAFRKRRLFNEKARPQTRTRP